MTFIPCLESVTTAWTGGRSEGGDGDEFHSLFGVCNIYLFIFT